MGISRAAFAAVLALAVIKLWALVAYGPVYLPDSVDYIAFADAILGDRGWLTRLDLRGQLFPLTTSRVIGYPALIAAAKLVAGDAWPWLICLVQTAASLGATLMVYVLAERLSGRRWVGIAALLAHGFGLGFVLDQCILTDSLNASLLIIAAAAMSLGILRRQAPGAGKAAAVGGLLLAAFLMREAGATTQYLLWPLAALWGLAGGGPRRAAVTLIAFALPLFVGIQAYKGWNQARSGARFITTVTQTALYHPAVDLARRGVPVFAEDPLLADLPALRGPLPENPGVVFTWINQHLMTAKGLDAVGITRHAEGMFWRHWRDYPLERVKIYLGKFNRYYAYLPVMPLTAAERLAVWAGGRSPFPPPGGLWPSLRDDFRIDHLALVAARSLARLTAALLTAVFAVGVPAVAMLAFLGRGAAAWQAPRPALMAALWLYATAFPLMYALVYLEDRYLLPVTPFVLVVALCLAAPGCERAGRRLRRLVRPSPAA